MIRITGRILFRVADFTHSCELGGGSHLLRRTKSSGAVTHIPRACRGRRHLITVLDRTLRRAPERPEASGRYASRTIRRREGKPGCARLATMQRPARPRSGLLDVRHTHNNPVRYTDPSGHAICVDDECEIVFGPQQRELIPRGRGAVVWYYQSGLGMVKDWLTESGPQTRYYGESAPMTQDLMQDEGIKQARAHYYLTGEPRYHYSFSNPKQPLREAVQWVTGEDKTGVGSVLGSYTVYIQNNGDGTVTIWVKNVISRESGTRLLGFESSVEDTVVSGQVGEKTQALTAELQKFASGQGTLQDVRKRLPVSILNSTVRGHSSATGLVPGVWGGDMEVWYMWTEPLCISCY